MNVNKNLIALAIIGVLLVIEVHESLHTMTGNPYPTYKYNVLHYC